MATFDANVETIKTAQYGFQVRDAMAEGLQQCYEKADATKPLSFTGTSTSAEITLPSGGVLTILYNETENTNHWITLKYKRTSSGTESTVAKYRRLDTASTSGVTPGEILSDGSFYAALSEVKAPTTRVTRIKVTSSFIDVSVLTTSTDETSAGLGTISDIVLSGASYICGYSPSSNVSPPSFSSSMVLDKTLPIRMSLFGGPGEFVRISSSVDVKYTMPSKTFHRDLSKSGVVAGQYETHFVFTQ